MNSFLKEKKNLYPLEAIFASFFVIVFGLLSVKREYILFFIIGFWFLNFFLVSMKKSLKILLGLVIIGGMFSIVSYFASSKDLNVVKETIARFGIIFIGSIPAFSIEPIKLTRNLSQLRFPKKMILGILIVFSFGSYLRKEIKRVKQAMKTRGISSRLRPSIFYRAFLIPFITRLLDISDTLSLSIETRGFSNKGKRSIYKKEKFNYWDLVYLLFLAFNVCVVFL